jgi:hypothetical protein
MRHQPTSRLGNLHHHILIGATDIKFLGFQENITPSVSCRLADQAYSYQIRTVSSENNPDYLRENTREINIIHANDKIIHPIGSPSEVVWKIRWCEICHRNETAFPQD